MKFCVLPHTDFEVSRIAFGCWAIVGGFNWGPQDEVESIAALRAAFDCGVTFFDTAEAYGDGRSEVLLRRALGHVRNKIIVATKVSPRHYMSSELEAACERSLRNLGTDWIDLYQLHWPSREIPISEPIGVLERLRETGKIRAWGVSNFGVADLKSALEASPRISVNQVAYSLLFRAIEFEILPFCRKVGIPILAYSPLMQGLLTGKFASLTDVPVERRRTRHYSCLQPGTRHGEAGAEAETFSAVNAIRDIAMKIGLHMSHLALVWLLAQPGVACVIVGARNAEQARHNALAARIILPEKTIEELNAVTGPLKQKLGLNADMWQSHSRIR